MSTSIGSYVTLTPAKEAGKPAATSQPFQFKATNGKTYEITYIRQRVAGEGSKWKDVDLSQLDAVQKELLIKTAALATGVFQKIQDTDDFKDAESFTLTYRQHLQSGPQKFHEISYTTPTAERSIKVHLDQYSPEDQKTIEEMVNPLSQMLDSVVQKRKTQNKQLKKAGAGRDELTLRDAGGGGNNKCAARSIAMLMKERGDTRDVNVIAQGLVKDALNAIETDADFLDVHHPKYRALLSAVEEYNQDEMKKAENSREEFAEINYIDTKNPKQMRADYMTAIRKNESEMLDLPFFYTLDKPTIILDKDNKIIAMVPYQESFTQLATEDLKSINIVYYDQNHYQAVIPSENNNLAIIKTILQKHKELLSETDIFYSCEDSSDEDSL